MCLTLVRRHRVHHMQSVSFYKIIKSVQSQPVSFFLSFSFVVLESDLNKDQFTYSKMRDPRSSKLSTWLAL